LLSTVQGRLEVTTHTRVEGTSDEWVETSAIVPFSYLGLDIPPSPLFKDSQGGMVIAQVPLFELLRKYDGKTWTDSIVAGNVVRKKYRVLSLPDYLVLHLNRFTKNNFYEEKNPTIVTFPVKNLELKDYLVQSEGIPPLSLATTAKDLLAVVREFGTAVEKRLAVNIVEKEALLELATRIQMQQLGSKYDLVANICHDSTASSGISEITSEITSGDK
jgi:U4/U6.U5 tri-snRNP-associated protein 2